VHLPMTLRGHAKTNDKYWGGDGLTGVQGGLTSWEARGARKTQQTQPRHMASAAWLSHKERAPKVIQTISVTGSLHAYLV
jgi:hypothetical protein